jgi:hypothetical protein
LTPKTTRNTATRKTTRKAPVPARKQHAVARTAATGVRQARMGRELAAASGKTVAYRAALIAKAAESGSGLGEPELARMSVEKGAVAIESSAAMAGKLRGLNLILMDFWLLQLHRSTSSGLALAACRSLPAAAAVGVRTAQTMFSDIITAGIRMTRSTQDATDSWLKPVHRVASANAVRLGGRSPNPSTPSRTS